MLTFMAPRPNGPPQTGGRPKDSAAVSISNADYFEDLSHEAHLSTEQPCARSPSRFPSAHVHRCWSQYLERAPCAWPQEAFGLIETDMKGRDTRGYSVMQKRSAFLAANRGKRYATPGFVLLVFDRRDDDPSKRLGITITKKVGNAVVRNRMRRRFRALASEMLGDLGKAGGDHVLIGRDGGIERDFGLLREEMAKAFKKLCNQNRSAEPVEARIEVRAETGKRPSTGSGLR
jgi:ribonuclease P protein component